MQKIITLGLFLALVLSANLSLAQSYSSTCPTEAQAILSATGGCANIDSAVYSNIFANCCASSASNLTLIIYVLVAVIVLALAIWQIFKRKKDNQPITN